MEIIVEMMKALRNSLSELSERITNVKDAPIDDTEENRITFCLDGKPIVGVLRGRNADLLLGFGEAKDRAIATRVLLDGDYQSL